MVVKIHGSPFSTCTQRVVTVLLEKKVPYEIVVLDFAKAEHKSESHLQKQPFGKVPVLEDEDGFLVYESRAIAQYIALKYRNQGTDLFPADGDFEGFALLQQGISAELSNFDPPVSEIAHEKVFKGMAGGGPADEARVAALTAQLETVLTAYERILSKQKYFAGDKLTLADLFHLPYASFVENVGFAHVYAKYPAFNKWLKELQARDSWKKVTAK
ncbi:putative glutathione S-transferase [Xylogone sp. PMI_703]|nr:putative glutathione S-transferase [Xylogone sp. PMI_703]